MPKRWIERLLFAETCLLCGSPLGKHPLLCEVCINSIVSKEERNLLKIPHLDGYKTFTYYGEFEKQLLKRVKFEGFKSLARELGKIVETSLRSYIEELKPSAVGYIPTNPWRYWFLRGFDPVEEILKGAKVSYERFIKRRWIYRKPLSRARTSEERRRLVKGAFTLDKRFIPRLSGERILIVDDVLTSGATASEVAYLLKSVGAREVYLFAVFKAAPSP